MYVLSALLYRPDQGNIVGREYINFYKFLLPYGISLSDSTTVPSHLSEKTAHYRIGKSARNIPYGADIGRYNIIDII
jgi:hypothetical protein